MTKPTKCERCGRPLTEALSENVRVGFAGTSPAGPLPKPTEMLVLRCGDCGAEYPHDPLRDALENE
jgi:hypothetical protein